NMPTGEFLSYIPTLGFGTLLTTGFAGYDVNSAAFPAANNVPTQNYRITGASAIPAGGLNVNAISFRGGFNTTFTSGTDVLNLTSGGFSFNQAANSLGATVDSGRLTAGGTASSGTSALYLYQS